MEKVVDAAGKETRLFYELPPGPGNDLKITKVEDPFGRFATFDYDSSGRLEKITDVILIESAFDYETGPGDFIEKLTTPYGITSFATGIGNDPHQRDADRWLQVTDALGGKERVEYYPNCGFPHHSTGTGAGRGAYWWS